MKKITLKIVGAIFLILAIITTQIPGIPVFAKSEGSEVFEMNGTTLVKYTGTAKTVSITDNVEVIGEEAFAGNEYVTEVKIPSSVEKISYRAFADCPNLEKVVLPEELVSLGAGAFSNCAKLQEIYLGADCCEIGYGAFVGCKSLSEIKIAEKNSNFIYKNGLLMDDEEKELYCVVQGAKLKEVTVPRTVIKILPYAFWGCDTIQKVTLSEYMEYLDDYSLANLKNLKSIVIPYSVKGIGLKAFADCINLQDVTIHPTVRTIHESAFDGCTKLNILAEEGSVAAQYKDNLESQPIIEEEYEDVEDIIYNIRDDIQSIEDIITGNADNSGTITEENILGTSVVSSGHAVILIDNTKQTVNSGEDYSLEKEENKSDNSKSEIVDLFNTSDVKGNTIPKYTSVNNQIASRAFYGSQAMEQYTFPENITSIGEFSYARSNLKKVDIPDTVTTIGYGAFYHCDELSDVFIPESVTSIEAFAFQNTKWLKDWYATGQDFCIVGDGILLAYNGKDSHAVVPEGVKKIAPYAFYDHSGLLSVSLPDSLVEIGEAAFSGCVNLEDVYGGTNIVKICDRAFYECPLQTVKIPKTVEEVGLLAFDLSDGREAKEKTAIFYTDDIPSLSYEQSSTRLSNDWYRDYALKDVLFAVVPSETKKFENTVLGDSKNGFRGLIVSVVSEESATMELKECYLSEEEIQNMGISDKVTVFQKTYTISNFQEFLSHHTESTEKTSNTDIDKIEVLNLTSFLPVSKSYQANCEVMKGSYQLTINELENAEQISAFQTQYKNLYGEDLPENTCYLDLSLSEQDSNIPITKLGKNALKLSIPLTDALSKGTLHVVCLDSDGQLEEVSYTLSEDNGEKKAIIEIEHFSPYAMYTYKTNQFVAQAIVKDGEAVFTMGSEVLDESPDTGDYVDARWFLAGGFSAIGIILLLWKKKKV